MQQQMGINVSSLQGALGNIPGDLFSDKSPSKLYAELLKLDTLRYPIIDKYNLVTVYKKKLRQSVLAKMNRNISVSTGKEGIITVRVDDTDPKRAADMANDLINELRTLTVRLNNTGAGNNRIFLEESLAKAKVNLNSAAENLKKFQEAHKTLSFTEQAAGSIKGVAELEAQVAEKEVQLAMLRRSLTDTMPEVKNLKTIIANMKAQIARYEQGKGGGVVPKLGSAPELAKEYLSVMREYKTKEVIVDLLNKQYEMARIAEVNDVPSLQVLQKALPPEVKSKPARLKMILTSSVIALFFSVILVLILDAINYTKK